MEVTPEENMGDIVGILTVVEVRLMTWVIERAKLLRQMPLSEMSGYVTTLTGFHLVEQHLLWNFTLRGNSSISEAVIKKSKRKRLIFKKMSQKIRIKLKSTITC
jgi:hypothetical protein